MEDLSMKHVGLLGIFTSTYVFKKFIYGSNPTLEEKEQIDQALDGILYTKRALSLEFDQKEYNIQVRNQSSLDDIYDYVISRDSHTQIIEDEFGDDHDFYYMISKNITLNHCIFKYILDTTEETSKSYDAVEWKKSIANLLAFLKSIEKRIDYIEYINGNISSLFPDLITKAISLANSDSKDPALSNTVSLLNEINNKIFGDFHKFAHRYKIGTGYLNDLNKCPKGKKGWKEYEKICFRILRLLFSPPFSKIIEQSSTEYKDNRRDAVLPNNYGRGPFWDMIRAEYNSNHIICEFKNYSEPVSKDELNQLRLYLSRKTIGRFGILINRLEPTESLLQARKRAYEESSILILILDDDKVQEMVKTFIYLGKAEFYLEDLKAKFELLY